MCIRDRDSGASVARFTLAVDRRFKKDGGDEADFISCIAFGKTAEFLEKWFRKGQRLGLNGRIQTGSYVNQEGTKVYTTDVVAVSYTHLDVYKRQAPGTGTAWGFPRILCAGEF